MNEADILRLLPPVLKKDECFVALGKVIAEQLAENRELSEKALIYPAIERLDEPVLDALAYDLNVPWYDYEGDIESKRNTIRECMQIHQFKGTKYAVQTALESVYEQVQVREWFEYGGEPYHFKVTIYDSGSDAERRRRVLAKIKYYKNLRSVLEATEFIIAAKAELPVEAAFCVAGKRRSLGCRLDTRGMDVLRAYPAGGAVFRIVGKRRACGCRLDTRGMDALRVYPAADTAFTLVGKRKSIYTEVHNGNME